MNPILAIIIIGLLVLIGALSKAIMDTVACCFSSSIFKNLNPLFWDKSVSWKNKYKNGDPSQGPRFPGSTTIFVSFTDAWHLFQHFFLLTVFLIPVFYSQCFPIIAWTWWMVTDFILIYAAFTITFQLFYWLFNKK